jgi:regulator of RNase E activity RraA
MDIIVGDADGVIVVPKAVAEEVLARIESRKTFEDKTRELIKSGLTPEQAAVRMGAKLL